MKKLHRYREWLSSRYYYCMNLHRLSNSNSSKWSTIQGVIRWENFKSDSAKRDVDLTLRLRLLHELYNMMSTTKWLKSYRWQISKSKKVFWKLKSVALSISVKRACRKHLKGSWKRAHNWRAKGIQTQVSNHRKSFDTCNWTPTWLCADYVTNRYMENQLQLRILW